MENRLIVYMLGSTVCCYIFLDLKHLQYQIYFIKFTIKYRLIVYMIGSKVCCYIFLDFFNYEI